jgi:hypothetical protein
MTMPLDEMTCMMVDSYLTTAVANFRKIVADKKVAGRKFMGLKAPDFAPVADELERIRDAWRNGHV